MRCPRLLSILPAAGIEAIPVAGTGKSEVVPEFVDSKTSFGDKQKPLYQMPLKWRKLTGKPQVRLVDAFEVLPPFQEAGRVGRRRSMFVADLLLTAADMICFVGGC